MRLQLLYQASDDFSALFNAHARHLDGTARLFRANIIQPGTNQLVEGFDPENSFIDGANRQELQTYGGSANLTWDLGDIALHSITAYEGIGKYYSRGDIDGGFGAVFAPPSGPGVIPFPVENRRWHQEPGPVQPGSACAIAVRRPAQLAGRSVLLP